MALPPQNLQCSCNLQLSCWACRPKKSQVAALHPSSWVCRHKNLKYAECSCYPAALLLDLPPKKSQKVRLQLLPCSPLAGPTAKKSQVWSDRSCYCRGLQSKKSPIVRLQLLGRTLPARPKMAPFSEPKNGYLIISQKTVSPQPLFWRPLL